MLSKPEDPSSAPLAALAESRTRSRLKASVVKEERPSCSACRKRRGFRIVDAISPAAFAVLVELGALPAPAFTAPELDALPAPESAAEAEAPAPEEGTLLPAPQEGALLPAPEKDTLLPAPEFKTPTRHMALPLPLPLPELTLLPAPEPASAPEQTV